MKRFLMIALMICMLSSMNIFAEEEFSDSANIEYDYNGAYDENTEREEETSSRYDDISTSYDEELDESRDVEYGEEFDGEPDPEYADDSRFDNRYNGGEAISVFVNDERVSFDVAPTIINDRTMVPVRAIFEALGAEVRWDDEIETAIGVLDDTVVKIAIGKSYLVKNGKRIDIDTPAMIISDRTLVPVRAIAESFDCTVDWYDESQTVEITM